MHTFVISTGIAPGSSSNVIDEYFYVTDFEPPCSFLKFGRRFVRGVYFLEGGPLVQYRVCLGVCLFPFLFRPVTFSLFMCCCLEPEALLLVFFV